MQNARLCATAAITGLLRWIQTSIEGGSTDRELIELTVSPNRPPGPSVDTIPTVATALRIASKNALLSTPPSSPIDRNPRSGSVGDTASEPESGLDATTARSANRGLRVIASLFNVSAIAGLH
jgi:hypothetical protein